jgi:hypothetical protein
MTINPAQGNSMFIEHMEIRNGQVASLKSPHDLAITFYPAPGKVAAGDKPGAEIFRAARSSRAAGGFRECRANGKDGASVLFHFLGRGGEVLLPMNSLGHR